MNVKVKLSHRLIKRTLGREDVWKSKRISTLDNTDVSPLQNFAAILSQESCPQSLFMKLGGSQSSLETVVKMGRF
jgi:hypothetical protein